MTPSEWKFADAVDSEADKEGKLHEWAKQEAAGVGRGS